MNRAAATQTRCIFCSYRAGAAQFSTSATRGRDGGAALRKAKQENAYRKRIKQDRARGKTMFNGPRSDPSYSQRLSSRPLRVADDQAEWRSTSIKFLSLGDEQRAQNRVKELNDKVQRKGLAVDGRLRELGLGSEELSVLFRKFKKRIMKAFESLSGPNPDYIARRMKEVADKPGATDGMVDHEIISAFIGDVYESRLPDGIKEGNRAFADLRYPSEWYPSTRGFRRTFHLHIGPTNSGKTYHALKKLEEAESGLYAGPLRLLAHEVYSRMNAKGKRCALITGDDQRPADDSGKPAQMVSCTVEMVNIAKRMDVAVIDEIQLLGDEERGWAWTNAVLGVQAREVHLCGEARTEPIVRELVGMCGDELQVHNYERLSPLSMMPHSLDGRVTNLQKGDCVVAFSIQAIHGLRQTIEKQLQTKVAVIYGALPPETRAQQAELFNDPDSGYDILVASNAIGMGLNLSIKRMIFESSVKRIGKKMVPLAVPEIKQIGGRAGRFRTASQDVQSTHAVSSPLSPPKEPGWVTTLAHSDMSAIERAMAAEAERIFSAGIYPPAYMLERFARYFPPQTPFSQIFLRLCQMSKLQNRFHISSTGKVCGIADAIESVKDLSIADRMVICNAPIEPRKPKEPELACELATIIMEKRPVSVLDIEHLDLEALDDGYEPTRDYLKRIEVLHKGLMIYMWLSYRYKDIFADNHLAQHAKELTEHRIADVLEQMSFDYDAIRQRRELMAKKASRAQAAAPKQSISSVIESVMAADFTDAVELAETLSDASAEEITQLSEELDTLTQRLGFATSMAGEEQTSKLWPLPQQPSTTVAEHSV